MANFRNGYILTDKGKALQAKVEAGTATLKVSRMVLGDGTVDSIDEYRSMTALKHRVYNMIISKVEQVGNVCAFEASTSSESIDTGFYASELGLYAMDGDSEILYLISYDNDPQYIPGMNDGVAVEIGFSVPVTFADNAQVTITIPKTQEEIVTLVQNNAAKSIDAANAAAASERNAKDSADRVETNMKNAAISESNAASSAARAEASADSIAERTKSDVSEATKQASNAASSASEAASARDTAQELYKRWCVDIIGPPASAMVKADMFVAPGAAAMAAMRR